MCVYMWLRGECWCISPCDLRAITGVYDVPLEKLQFHNIWKIPKTGEQKMTSSLIYSPTVLISTIYFLFVLQYRRPIYLSSVEHLFYSRIPL